MIPPAAPDFLPCMPARRWWPPTWLFATKRSPTAWFIAHDERYAKYSPGVALIAEVIAKAAADGLLEVDLGAGDYRFKRSFASQTRLVAHGFVGLPSAASLVRAAAYRVRAVAEALPLGSASALPGKAMRRLDVIRSLS